MLTEAFCIVIGILANVVCYLLNENSVPHSRLRLPKILLLSNRAEWAPQRPQSFWAFDMLDPRDLYTSHWAPRRWLLAVRWLNLLYFCACLLTECNVADGFGYEPGIWLVYFTNWTFTLYGLWGVLGVILTHRAILRNGEGEDVDAKGRGTEVLADGRREGGWPKRWEPASVLYIVLYQLVPVAMLFLSCFFWAIANYKRTISADDIMKHSIINAVILMDVFMARTPFVSYHVEITIAYGSIYVAFAWIYHAASGRWVYRAMDWSLPLSPVLYLFLPIMLFVCFLIWWGLASLREFVSKRVKGRQPQASQHDVEAIPFSTSQTHVTGAAEPVP